MIDFACGIPHALKGECAHGAGPSIDVYSLRQLLGMVCRVTPCNFPATISI